jgi:hypothetical protein
MGINQVNLHGLNKIRFKFKYTHNQSITVAQI